MKRITRNLAVVVMAVLLCLLSACGGDDYGWGAGTDEKVSLDVIRNEAEHFAGKYNNLDFSETIFHITENDSISNLTCQVNNKNIEEKLVNNVKKFKKSNKVDVDKFFYVIPDEDNENQEKVVMNKATEEQKRQAWFLIYNDGIDCAVLWAPVYMMELGHSSLIAELSHQAMDNTWGVRPPDSSGTEKTYLISDKNVPEDSYMLSDGMMSIQDAITRVEQCVNQDYAFVKSDFLESKVCEVQAVPLDDGKYFYNFKLAVYYNGILFDKDGSGIFMDEEPEYEPFSVCHSASMFKVDSVDYIWSCCHSYEEIEETEVNTEFISLKRACYLLSTSVAESKEFHIDEVTLEYETDFYNDESEPVHYVEDIKCHPVYCFKVGNPQISGYSQLYFYVDALTGKVGISYI